jgi:cytochrome o ubiquinol oxidase subunit 2
MLLFSAFILLLTLLLQPLEVFHFQDHLDVLFPKGIIALEQRNLLLIIQALMLFVIVPVYILTFLFSWVYRADNTKSIYDPDLTDNVIAEYIWWGIPLIFTVAISVLTWIKTYELDPYKPIASEKKPITIQVVALQWKWLFLYPEHKIATVNFVQFPKETPIHFEITADAPMNSFWIPRLSGQIYAMPNMKTELNMIANETGEFRGSSANLSGEGFSGMTFVTKASTEEEYQEFIEKAKQVEKTLEFKAYTTLAAPSQNNPVEIFKLEGNLFQQIMDKYAKP